MTDNRDRRDAGDEGGNAPSGYPEQGPQADSNTPEPPPRFTPHVRQPLHVQHPAMPPAPDAEFNRLRKYVTVSQILALVSLIIGGVLLSAIALIVAVLGFRGCAVHLATNDPKWLALRRSARIGIIMCIGALALNAISIIVLYPMIIDMMQSSNPSALVWPGGTSGGSGTSSFWG